MLVKVEVKGQQSHILKNGGTIEALGTARCSMKQKSKMVGQQYLVAGDNEKDWTRYPSMLHA